MSGRSLVVFPAVAGVIMFGWGIGWALGGFVECAQGDEWSTDMGWAVAGVALALLVSSLGAGVLAFRLGGWLAPVGTLLTIVAIALGAQIGEAIAMNLVDCDFGDEGPWLTAGLLATVGAVFGYVIGWFLRRSDM